MRRAIRVHSPAHAPGNETCISMTLPFFDRHRRRRRMTDDNGADFLLDLPVAALLAEGDCLTLDDGTEIIVRAAAEAVVDVTCRDAAHSARIAWHIGNRHTPVQILNDGGLRVADDHVLVQMIIGLGGKVQHITAPFQPEGGAYTQGEGQHGHHHHG